MLNTTGGSSAIRSANIHLPDFGLCILLQACALVPRSTVAALWHSDNALCGHGGYWGPVMTVRVPLLPGLQHSKALF